MRPVYPVHHHCAQIVGDWAEKVLQNLTVSSQSFFEIIKENVDDVRASAIRASYQP